MILVDQEYKGSMTTAQEFDEGMRNEISTIAIDDKVISFNRLVLCHVSGLH